MPRTVWGTRPPWKKKVEPVPSQGRQPNARVTQQHAGAHVIRCRTKGARNESTSHEEKP